MKRELLYSAFRVWLFSPPTAIMSSGSLKLPKVWGKTITSTEASLRIIFLAYSCSSWTKASILLRQSEYLFGDVDVSRADLLAFGYLLQSAWQALMQSRYPDREIVIAFDPQDEDALDEIQINLYEESAL